MGRGSDKFSFRCQRIKFRTGPLVKERVLLSIGHGYSARTLSRMLVKEAGWRVIGTSRNESGRDRIIESFASWRVWPTGSIDEEIARATHILVSVPPDKFGDPVIRLLRDQLAGAAKNLDWVGYLSTTAVYGDRGGAWVDETAEVAPSTLRGKKRAEAEQAWQCLARQFDLPLHIFRLAGIYGPGRNSIEQIKSGKKTWQVVKDGQIFSRIHVEDIARILLASMCRPESMAVYNVCDDYPASPEEVVDFACQLLGMPPLERVDFEAADLSPMAKSFYAESKRVSNRATKHRLEVSLLYPDFKAGLQSLLT